MTIDEAIKILHKDSKVRNRLSFFDLAEAEKLGIAALEKVRELRDDTCSIANSLSWPLHGETGFFMGEEKNASKQ